MLSVSFSPSEDSEYKKMQQYRVKFIYGSQLVQNGHYNVHQGDDTMRILSTDQFCLYINSPDILHENKHC